MRHRDGGQLEHELKCTMPLAEITGLRSGCLYRFRVQAFNEVSAELPMQPQSAHSFVLSCQPQKLNVD